MEAVRAYGQALQIDPEYPAAKEGMTDAKKALSRTHAQQ
jgi:cytochrome c-type biogenesis protein CcmH/NrfG